MSGQSRLVQMACHHEDGSGQTGEVMQPGNVVLRERQARDRGWWDVMRQYFHQQSFVDLSWFRGSGQKFVAESQRMSGDGLPVVHRLAPPIAHVHEDRAVVELPAAIELRVRVQGVEADLASYGRLIYRLQRDNSHWLIRSLTSVYERDTLVPAVPGDTIELDRHELARHRSPYRCLAYVLNLSGRSIPDDLYADDDPERVSELYGAAFEWLVEEAPSPMSSSPSE